MHVHIHTITKLKPINIFTWSFIKEGEPHGKSAQFTRPEFAL